MPDGTAAGADGAVGAARPSTDGRSHGARRPPPVLRGGGAGGGDAASGRCLGRSGRCLGRRPPGHGGPSGDRGRRRLGTAMTARSGARPQRWPRQPATSPDGRPASLLLVAIVLVVARPGGHGLRVRLRGFRFDQVPKVNVPHLSRRRSGAAVQRAAHRLGLPGRGPNGRPAPSAAWRPDGGQRSDVVKICTSCRPPGRPASCRSPGTPWWPWPATPPTRAVQPHQHDLRQRPRPARADHPEQLRHPHQPRGPGGLRRVRGGGQRRRRHLHGLPLPGQGRLLGSQHHPDGCQLLNGIQALAVARSRHYQYYEDGEWQYDRTSDFGRIQRQDAFLRALIDQAKTKYNPLTLNAFVGSVRPGPDDRFDLHRQRPASAWPSEFHGFSSNALQTATLPTYLRSSYEFAVAGRRPLRPAAPGRPGDRPVPRRPPPTPADDPAARPRRWSRRRRPPRRDATEHATGWRVHPVDVSRVGDHHHDRHQLRPDALPAADAGTPHRVRADPPDSTAGPASRAAGDAAQAVGDLVEALGSGCSS